MTKIEKLNIVVEGDGEIEEEEDEENVDFYELETLYEEVQELSNPELLAELKKIPNFPLEISSELLSSRDLTFPLILGNPDLGTKLKRELLDVAFAMELGNQNPAHEITAILNYLDPVAFLRMYLVTENLKKLG